MSYKKSQNQLVNKIMGGHTLIQVATEDDIPVVNTFVTLARDKISPDAEPNSGKLVYDVVTWNLHSNFNKELDRSGVDGKFPKIKAEDDWFVTAEKVMQGIIDYEGSAIFVLHDFDSLYEQANVPGLVKETARAIANPIRSNGSIPRHMMINNKGYSKHIVIVSSKGYVPPEVEKLTNMVEFGMPGAEEIKKIVGEIAANRKITVTPEEEYRIVQAAIGLTEKEVEDALITSYIQEGELCASAVSEVKEQIIKKGGLLEFISPEANRGDVGGAKNLFDFVMKRSVAFDEKLRKERKLDYPKGVVLVGVPGTGKSYSVQAIASELGFPLLKFDIGSLMNKYVGDSERNMRKVLRMAEAVAPCILHIDEIEKSMPKKGGDSHEVTQRMFGNLLDWMQTRTEPVFIAATANDVDKLPPELLRRGRIDEKFFFDLPGPEERKEILKIHLAKIGVDGENFNLPLLRKKLRGFTGAEIKALVNEANFQSAYEGEPLTEKYLLEQIEVMIPDSQTRKTDIDRIRNWRKETNTRLVSAEAFDEEVEEEEEEEFVEEQEPEPVAQGRNSGFGMF